MKTILLIQFYESVLDSTVDGVVVVDKDYKVLYINKTVENWVGFKRKDAVGKHCREVAPEMDCDKVCPPRLTFKDGKSHVVENVIATKDGDRMYQLVSSSPLHEDGEVVGCIEVIKDITEQKLAEAKVQETVQELEKWQKHATGRELKMVELKKEIKELKKKLS
jgi:PAS domain S-box-containing protein